MAASQPNKATRKWEEDKDEEGERPGWWVEAARKVREEEAAEHKRKKEEAEQARREHRQKLVFEHLERERQFHAKILAKKKLEEQVAQEKWLKSLLVEKARIERENRQFNEKVLREARRAREREEEEEEDERKRKGKGPSSTQ